MRRTYLYAAMIPQGGTQRRRWSFYEAVKYWLSRPMHSHEFYMRIALTEAHRACEIGEVPVGAVVISSRGEVLSKSHNETMRQNDPSAHAEIIALREAAKILKNYRLNKTRIYVTIEPCVMCAGALIHARVEEVIFGVSDPKGGGLVTLYQLGNDTRLNHRLKVTSGVLETECGEIIQRFFKEKRKTNGKNR